MLHRILKKVFDQTDPAQPPVRLLESQELDERHSPGTILADFETLLQVIGEAGLGTAGKHNLFPIGILNELNLRMTHPVPHHLQRPQQRSLPNLNGLYLLLRSTEMVMVEGGGAKARLVLDLERVMAWRGLNVAERYLSLVECWMHRGSLQVINHSGQGELHCLNALVDTLSIVTSVRRTQNRDLNDYLSSVDSLALLALAGLFGWMTVVYGEPRVDGKVRIVSGEITKFGVGMLQVLLDRYRERRLLDDEAPDDRPPLATVFGRYFPALKQTLPARLCPRKSGTLIWKVSLGDIWRRIATPDNTSFAQFAEAIIDSVRFDHAHCYCFDFRDRDGRTKRISNVQIDNNDELADSYTAGEVPFDIGGSLEFLYDFGDEWRFDVRLEELKPDSRLESPRVLKSHGKAPTQYVDYDV